MNIWGKITLRRGSSECKDLGIGTYLECLCNGTEIGMAGTNE